MHTRGFELLLPEGVLDYFEIINVEQTKSNTSIYLQEKNIIPEEYIGRRLEDQVKKLWGISKNISFVAKTDVYKWV